MLNFVKDKKGGKQEKKKKKLPKEKTSILLSVCLVVFEVYLKFWFVYI